MENTPLVAVAAEHDAACQRQAEELAAHLHLALAPLADNAFPLLLVVTPERLELRHTGPRPPGPIAVDFIGGAVGFRRSHGGGRKQPLARAVGLKGNRNPTVVDATAGLGRDGFVLASLGCRVTLIERSPILAALVADGMRRAMADPKTVTIVTERLRLLSGDSRTLLLAMSQTERPEVIYLDPMYPHRSKSALVKKEMRALRLLVGDDTDAPALLEAALATANERVVVKRPIKARAIAGPEPTLAIAGKTHRFDVYRII